MKKLIKPNLLFPFLLSVLISLSVQAQNGMYYDADHNFLIPMTENNELKGYANVYLFDKLSKDSNAYIIEAYDELLRDIGEKKIVISSNFTFHSAIYNGKNYVFKFVHENKELKYMVFDHEAKQLFDTTFSIHIKQIDKNPPEWEMNYTPMQNVANIGVADYVWVQDGKYAKPTLIFLSDDNKIWQYTFESKNPQYNAIYIGSDANTIVNACYEFTTNKSKTQIQTRVVTLNTQGGLLADSRLNTNDSITLLPVKAEIVSGKIKLLSEFTKRYSKNGRVKYGIATHEISKNGQIYTSAYNEITKTMITDSLMKKFKLMNNSYLYLHKAIWLHSGKWLVAAEQLQKTTIKISLLKPPYTKFNKFNICLWEIDNDAQITNAFVIANKGDAVKLQNKHFRSPELGAFNIHTRNKLDFQYFLSDSKNKNRHSYIFRDYDAETGKSWIGNVIYDDGKFSIDKFSIPKFSSYTRIGTFPARIGHLLLIKYDPILGLFDFDNIKFNN